MTCIKAGRDAIVCVDPQYHIRDQNGRVWRAGRSKSIARFIFSGTKDSV